MQFQRRAGAIAQAWVDGDGILIPLGDSIDPLFGRQMETEWATPTIRQWVPSINDHVSLNLGLILAIDGLNVNISTNSTRGKSLRDAVYAAGEGAVSRWGAIEKKSPRQFDESSPLSDLQLPDNYFDKLGPFSFSIQEFAEDLADGFNDILGKLETYVQFGQDTGQAQLIFEDFFGQIMMADPEWLESVKGRSKTWKAHHPLKWLERMGLDVDFPRKIEGVLSSIQHNGQLVPHFVIAPRSAIGLMPADLAHAASCLDTLGAEPQGLRARSLSGRVL